MTIDPIICYLIRRYYYPSFYFKDKSFFFFNGKSKANLNEQKFKDEIYDFFYIDKNYHFSIHYLIRELLKEIKEDEQIIEIQEFNENEFIPLRKITCKNFFTIELVMHKESLYIFAIKKYNTLIENCIHFLDHEVSFCKNYSHRCFTKCYGFIKEDKRVKSIIYEFLSNNTLNNAKEKINEINLITTIIRLYKAISFLQKHNLIHQDIKPTNILFNHDFVPFLNDFESIREVGHEDMTVDIYTKGFSSPEQKDDKFGIISFPTDIYSFGQIVNFLSDCIHSDVTNSLKILSQICIKEDQNERAQIDQIRDNINKLLDDFYLKEKFFIRLIKNSKQKNEIIQMFFENFTFIDRDNNNSFVDQILFYILFNFLNYDDYLEVLHIYGTYYLYGIEVKLNYKLAKTYLKMSAALNHCLSNEILCNLYLTGQGVKQNMIKASKYAEVASQIKNSSDILIFGVMNILGLGVKPNIKKGIELLEKPNQNNNKYADLALGYMNYLGIGIEKKYNKAKKYFELADQKNDSFASFCLGTMYFNGKGVQLDYEKAFYYFEKSSKQNNIFAFYNLALMYQDGLGCVKDLDKTRHYFEITAKANICCSNLRLGLIYNEGLGVEKDHFLAKEYFEKAAKDDNSEAYIQLAQLYIDGKIGEKNFQMTKRCYELAAFSGNSEAIFKLGLLYFKGQEIQKNYKKSLEYFELASKKDNPDSLFYEALQYENGLGIESDIVKAIELYKKCTEIEKYQIIIKGSNEEFIKSINKKCDEGNEIGFLIKSSIDLFSICKDIDIPDSIKNQDLIFKEELTKINENYYHAFNNLGLCYITEFEDFDEAFMYIKRAGLNEFPFGQNNIGILYQYIFNNLQDAEYFYQKSSNYHFALAEYNFGYLYEKENYEKAIEHYIKASEYGEKPFIFHEKIYNDDERFNISQLFIICLTNLKLAFYFLSKKSSSDYIEKAKDYLLKALVNPVLKLLNHFENYSFEFVFISNENNEINISDFILNLPLFGFYAKYNDSKWKIYESDTNKITIYNRIRNAAKSKSFKSNHESISKAFDDKMFINETFNVQKSIINLQENTIIDINSNSNTEDVLNAFKKIIEMMLENMNETKKIILNIIHEIDQMLITPPYLILLGRIQMYDLNSNTLCEEINDSFYDGISGKDEKKQ